MYTTQVAALAVAVDALAPEAGTLDAGVRRWCRPGRRGDAGDPGRPGRDGDRAGPHRRGPGQWPRTGFGTTLEVALKLEETCLRPVRGLSYADLKHGPIAIVDHELATLLVAGPEGPTLPGLVDLARTVRGKGSPVLGFGGDEAFRAACDLAVAGPELSEMLAPLALPIPAQLMVERLARELGLDPDAPRGLNKVTQTD